MSDMMFRIIANELQVKPWQVAAAVQLLDEGNTVPFVARYRKEATGELKDEQLRTLEERIAYLRNLEQRRQEILHSIEEHGKLTDELAEAIQKAQKLQELEDLYLPYRPKKRTRASIARERGLEPLAQRMVGANVATEGDCMAMASEFISEEVPTAEDALQGACDIIAEDASDRADIRAYLRDQIRSQGEIGTILTDDEKLREKFLQYEEYSEKVSQMPSHRILAVNRGEKLGALKVALHVPDDMLVAHLIDMVKNEKSIFNEYVEKAVADAYKRLIMPSMERELRNELTESADEQAIKVFGTNLKNLLLQAPLAGHVIMGLDPGFVTGCKMAIIDSLGNVLDYSTHYITTGQGQAKREQKVLADKIRKFKVTLLSIGNGTASYETEQFVSNMIKEEGLDCQYIITNEAGASVYSASKLAIEELPDLDVSIRGAVSIARRVQDPLAESVKIDPKSIGVGQYQHDVNQKQLSETLDNVVEHVVNYVGVELNTASPAILQHVSGISSAVAKNIYAYRSDHGPFTNRKELLKVARLGPAAFTQCAGFLRIKDSTNPLDNTPVHPESYGVAEKIVKELGFSIDDLHDKKELSFLQAKLPLVDAEKMAQKVDAGVPTVRDILEALAKPGRDPREDLPTPVTRKHVVTLEDLQIGSVVKGTVHNVVDFGAFLDIGLKVNGLLHRSELCNRQQHPSDVIAVGDVVDVEIISVDVKRNRIGLSMKSLREKKRREDRKKNGDFTNIENRRHDAQKNNDRQNFSKGRR